MANLDPSPELAAILPATSALTEQNQTSEGPRLQQAQAELEYRLRFEELLLSLSARFINLPSERFDAELQEALRSVTTFTGVDRSFLYLFDEQAKEARLYAEWLVPGLAPMAEPLRRIPIADHPWAQDALYGNKPIHIPQLADLPEEAEAFRRQIEALGVKSYINVPMLLGDQVVGHLGCTIYSQEKTWSDDEIALLRLLGGVLINAIKRRETEEALAEQERRLRLTVESLEEGVFDWDIVSGKTYLSDYLKRSVGLPELRGGWSFDSWAERIHPDDRAEVLDNLNAHLEGRSPVYNVEYRFLTQNNGYRWMLSRGRVVELADDGAPLRMVGVQRDITTQVEQRNEQRRHEAQLAHLGRVAAMGETVAGIAHEVNQPLHAASAFCSAARQALRSAKTDSVDKAVGFCEQATDQIHRVGEIMRRLRDFSRPRPKKTAAIGLNETIGQAIEFVSQLGATRDVQVQIALAPEQPRVIADRIQLEQVLVNLLQNACDSLASSGDPSPVITVSTDLTDGVVETSVIDNSSAPPPAEPEKLFDPFHTTKPDGMGIGLALCRTIVSAHGGHIRASANDGHGMGFRFTLPLAQEHRAH